MSNISKAIKEDLSQAFSLSHRALQGLNENCRNCGAPHDGKQCTHCGTLIFAERAKPDIKKALRPITVEFRNFNREVNISDEVWQEYPELHHKISVEDCRFILSDSGGHTDVERFAEELGLGWFQDPFAVMTVFCDISIQMPAKDLNKTIKVGEGIKRMILFVKE